MWATEPRKAMVPLTAAGIVILKGKVGHQADAGDLRVGLSGLGFLLARESKLSHDLSGNSILGVDLQFSHWVHLILFEQLFIYFKAMHETRRQTKLLQSDLRSF